LICYGDKTVFDGILMYVIQSSEIGTLVGQPRVPEIEPDLPPSGDIKPVHLAGCVGMEMLEQFLRSRQPGLARATKW